MKKRMNHLAGMAAAMLLSLTACNEETALTLPAEPQNPPVADNSGNVYITGDDFTWELGDEGGASSIHAVTRTQLTVEGNVAKFTWTPGDRVGILPDAGAQVWFEIPAPEEGETPTNTATFDGGAWALKPTSDYAAYYPFVKDFDLDRTKVPVSYMGQAQTGNGTTAHLGAYDYQGARPSTTNGAGGVSFDFDHVGALVLLRFTVPTSGTELTGVTLSADGADFTTAGTYDLTSTEGFPITPTETSESMTIGLDYTTTADNETVTLYFMCAPIDLSGKTVDVSVACGSEEGETLKLMADGKNLLAAGGYLLEAKENIPYLTFSADAEQTLTLTQIGSPTAVDYQYSVNGAGWNKVTAGEAIAFGGEAGNLRFRAKSPIGTATDSENYYQISFGIEETSVECTGDIRTLVDWENYAKANTATARFCHLFQYCYSLTTAPELPATTLAEYCYEGMFYGCTDLTTAPKLPATTLAEHCYQSMFPYCHALTTAPELPATTLADDCYHGMFQNCSNLTTAPELPATTLAEYCYAYMFNNCSDLTTAPELPATTLAKHCYDNMFSSCSDLTTAPELPATTLASDCYYGMFQNCYSLTTTPELPATTLAEYCYAYMFSRCRTLTTALELPATTLAKHCYDNMFSSCSDLTTAPELPATTLAEYCYYRMFQYCSSLTTAPELPATTLASNYYYDMFRECSALTTAPELPATTLANWCYRAMFQNCSNLTTAPILPATTLVRQCYYSMFNGCSSLSSITMLATDISAIGCLDSWVDGVSSSGTFYMNSAATWTTTGTSGIPEGWTVQDYTPAGE